MGLDSEKFESSLKAVKVYSGVLGAAKDCYFAKRDDKDEVVQIASELLLGELKSLKKIKKD